MADPGVPDTDDAPADVPTGATTLPCGEAVRPADIDLGMREYACACGDTHAVVLDVHPPTRFLPADVVAVLRETVEVGEDDPFEEFGTPHLMGSLREEFPDAVVTLDATDDGSAGYALGWVADFDSRTLHEHVVELVVELMEHAVSHTRDDAALGEFETQMLDFDVDAFVETYRAERDFDDEYDRPA